MLYQLLRRGKNPDSIKTRIETFFIFISSLVCFGKNPDSIKTRIETLCHSFNCFFVIYVRTLIPLKQG